MPASCPPAAPAPTAAGRRPCRRLLLVLAVLLVIGVVAGVVVVATRGHHPTASVQSVVSETNPTGLREVFRDDFSTDTTIDRSGTGRPGFLWYTDAPFGWQSTPSSALTVEDGALTISPPRSKQNYQLATASARSKTGRGFRFGYFEARLRFDPRHAARSDGFPAFWGLSLDQVHGAGRPRSPELDFFEALPPMGKRGTPFADEFAGTVHDLLLHPVVDRASYGNNTAHLPGTDWTRFHTYGCWWQPGLLQWYFDGHRVLTQRYSASAAPIPNPGGLPDGTFSVLDTDPGGQMVVLGTGARYPLTVDWVRVLQ